MIRRLIICGILLFAHCCICPAAMSKLDSVRQRYTEERPVRIMEDWEFAPYTFLSDDGNPTGITVEILHTLLDNLKINYSVRLSSWPEVFKMFKNHETDIIADVADAFYDVEDCYVGKEVVNYYPLAIVQRIGDKSINNFEDIDSSMRIALKTCDYACIYLEKNGLWRESMTKTMPLEAINGVIDKKYDAFIWGEMPLRHLMTNPQELGLQITHINCNLPEMRILCYDRQLLDVISDEYTRLVENGTIKDLRKKWLSNKIDDEKQIDLNLVSIIILSTILLVLIYTIILMFRRNKKKKILIEEILKEIKDVNKDNFITVFDKKKMTLSNLYGEFLHEDIKLSDLNRYMDETYMNILNTDLEDLENGLKDNVQRRIKWNITGDMNNPDWREIKMYCVIKREKNKKARYIYNSFSDVTKQVKEFAEIDNYTHIYKQIFENSVVAQAFFDEKGNMIEYNNSMKKVAQNLNLTGKLENVNIYDIAPFSYSVRRGETESLFTCCRYTNEITGEKSYYEIRYSAATDDEGKIIFLHLGALDKTEERNILQEGKKLKKDILKEQKQIDEYIQDFKHILESGNLTCWHLDETKTRYYVTKDLEHDILGYTLEEFGNLCSDDTRASWDNMIENLFNDSKDPVSCLVHVKYNVFSPTDAWMAMTGIPVFNEKGEKENYFGLSRNVTDLMTLEAQLKIEAELAKDSGNLKSTFMANMSHEIRTPLNSILGFSELMAEVGDEEKKELSRIIRNNCEMLIRLINDILDLSDMDSNGLVMKPKEVDFSKEFNDICMSLKGGVNNADIEFIIDNPCDKYMTLIDIDRIKQVITNFVTNSIKHTNQGHIRVGYKLYNDGLYIFCEDTGNGIPKDKVDQVFNRFFKLDTFTQGTGIGLSICKAIADASKGKIGVESEEGKGSTFWIWIPAVRIL